MSAQDIVVIVDEKLKGNGTDAKAQVEKTGEVLKAAGSVKLIFHFCSHTEIHDLHIINRENAIIVVTSSLSQLQTEAAKMQKEYGPEIRKVIAKRGRDLIVIPLKHPVVITGITRFAKSKGIPHADAMLRLGSLACRRS
jgi:hypothetical protein